MLKVLRKHSRSWFIALAIGAIVVVFIFWGVGSMDSSRSQEVAEVNGTPISVNAYIQQFNELVKQYQERSQGELTPETVKMLHLKEMAVSRLVDQTLLLQAGQRLGLTVSDAELREVIQSYPFFQRDGKFDPKRYEWLLARNHLSPAEFEAQERQRLLLKKVVDEVGSFAKVSDLQMEELARAAKETVEVKYLELTVPRFLAKQNPGDPEVARYYQDHQDLFKVSDRARVTYLAFHTKDFLNRVQVSSAEEKDYLSEHLKQFSRPKVIRVRQLFLKLPAKASPAEKRAVEKRAEELLAQALKGGDFAQLAKTYSQDTASKDQGGELGEVTRGQHPPEWDQAAFALQPGAVDRVLTPQGIYLIKLEEIKETEPLPDAAAKINQRLKTEKARALAREAAQQAREEWSKAAIPEAAKKYGVAPQETPLISHKDAVPGLGVLPLFNRTALALKPQEVSKVVALPNGSAVLKGVEHQAEHLPPLNQIKDQVKEALKKELARKQAAQEAGRLLEQLRQGKPLAQVAAQAGLTVKDSGSFTRFQGFLGNPRGEQVTTAAFQLSEKHPYPAHPLVLQDNYYILAFKSRKVPDQAELKKGLDQLKERYLEQKAQMIFASWLDQERKRAQIKTFELP
jgi:peptidyl-prolyl cis-trans isomerase D